MSRRIGLCIILGGLATAAAGCGGTGSKHYAMQPIFNCMNAAGVSVSIDTANPLFPSDAQALDADFRNFDVYLAVLNSPGEAQNTARKVGFVGSALGSKDAATSTGNVVYYSNDTSLNDDAKKIVNACLAGDSKSASSAMRHFNLANPVVYDSDFTSSFMTSCAKGGNYNRCRCVLTHGEQRYTQEQFSDIANALNDPSSKWYADGQRLLTECP